MVQSKTFAFRAGAAAILAVGCSMAVMAQTPRQYTTADYAAAEKFMAYNVNPLAYKGQVKAHWLEDGRFWYKDVDDTGVSYVLVDPSKGTRGPAFDQDKVASLLRAASGGAIKTDGRHLRVSEFSLSNGDRMLTLTTMWKHLALRPWGQPRFMHTLRISGRWAARRGEPRRRKDL